MPTWRTDHGMVTTDKALRGRHPRDFYPTPPALCEAALKAVQPALLNPPQFILDPGCGTGVWGQAARALWPDAWIAGCDVDKASIQQAEALGVYDYLAHASFNTGAYDAADHTTRYDLVIGNPPYKHAEAWVRRSLGLARPRHFGGNDGGKVVFLLRLAFLESQRRFQDMYQYHTGPSANLRPRLVSVVVERPSFTGDGKTDATAYAVFVWERGSQGFTILDWLSWRGDKP